MLELKNISKSFGGVKAVDKVSFKVEKGQITALIGPNGAGKTSLFDIITGLVEPDEGEIIFAGQNIDKMEGYKRARLGISRIFQQVRLFGNLSLAQHLRLVQDNEDMKFWKNIFWPGRIDNKKYQDFLADFGLKKELDTVVSDLSYGQRKLLQIAMAVFHPHQLLMLDEPVAGENSVAQNQIEQIILGLKQKGHTILLIDHDMDFVRRLSDKVIAFDAGRILTSGSAQEVLSDMRVVESYLGQ